METKRKISELNAVAEELNEVCGCKPAIKVAKPAKGKKSVTKIQKEALVAEIIEGAECIVLDEDEGDFAEDTIVILKELEAWPSDEEEVEEAEVIEEEEEDAEEEEEVVVEKPKKGKGKKEKKVKMEIVKDGEPEEDEDEESLSLEDKLKKAKKMVDLQAIIEEYPAEFKKAKKAIKEANNPIKLKKAMRDALGIVPAEKPVKEKAEKKMTRPTAVGLALKKNPKSLIKWAEAADAIYVESGGLSNLSKMKADIGYMLPTLDIMEVAYPAK